MHHSSRAKSAILAAGLLSLGALSFGQMMGCADGSDVDNNSSSSNTGASGTTGGSGGAGTGANGGTGNQSFGGQGGASTGGVGNAGGGTCAETSSEAFSEQLPADIIIAVDTSNSMAEGFPAGIGPSEISEVVNNLNSAAALVSGSGIDVHVVMIADNEVCIGVPLGSGSCPNDEKLPEYRHINHYVDSSLVYDSILSTYPDWSASLRPNATKTILVVTDDDDNMAGFGSANAFFEQLVALDPTFTDVTFDSIVAFEGPEVCLNGCGNDPCCPCWPASPLTWPLSAADGEAYRSLTLQTNGVEGNLCLQQFGPFFVDIANTVIQDTPIACNYEIPDPPMGETLDPKKVNVEYVPGQGSPDQIPNVVDEDGCGLSGWYYDDPQNPTEIIMCPTTCAALQSDEDGKVNVKFGCETEVVAN